MVRRCTSDKRWLTRLLTRGCLLISWLNRGPRHGQVGSYCQQACSSNLHVWAWVYESMDASLCLSSWTVSQIWDLCLMSSLERAERACWAPDDGAGTSASFYLPCQFVSLFLTHKLTYMTMAMHYYGKRGCIFKHTCQFSCLFCEIRVLRTLLLSSCVSTSSPLCVCVSNLISRPRHMFSILINTQLS